MHRMVWDFDIVFDSLVFNWICLIDLDQALTSLQTDPSWRKDGYKAEPVKPGALILIEIRTVNHPITRLDGSKIEGRDQLINVQFNSLDVIANQDTVVELAGFFQRVMPKKTPDQSHSNETASFPATLCVPEGKLLLIRTWFIHICHSEPFVGPSWTFDSLETIHTKALQTSRSNSTDWRFCCCDPRWRTTCWSAAKWPRYPSRTRASKPVWHRKSLSKDPLVDFRYVELLHFVLFVWLIDFILLLMSDQYVV